uniref:Transcriptional regulator n=1 Tax=Strongyloides venezuelensis TaxID=75913 RepID=A0A0K0G5B5_STRVS
MAGTERKVLQKYYTPGFDGSKNINFNLENLIEQKASLITDDVKAQEKDDEELVDSLFGNKNESSTQKFLKRL